MVQLIAGQKTVSVTFSLEPVHNAIASFALLDMDKNFVGLDEWVYRAASVLSPQQRYINRYIVQDAAVHLVGDVSWPSFEAWVDDLAARDATLLRDDVAHALFAETYKIADREMPPLSKLVADDAVFVLLLKQIYEDEQGLGDHALWEDMHSMFIDSSAMQEQIVSHLRAVWYGGLAAEWKRHLPMLQDSISAFRSLDMSGLTMAEALTRVSLRQVPPPIGNHWDNYEHITFIPSLHTGPYLLQLGSLDDSMARVVYGARIPEGTFLHSSTLSRSELLMRLNALANDTRLCILHLLAHERELNTSQIMDRLELSQSATSRHLENLAATGYLTVRGEGRVKFYQLDRDQVDHTFGALRRFCQ